jgi:hypothetical protein
MGGVEINHEGEILGPNGYVEAFGLQLLIMYFFAVQSLDCLEQEKYVVEYMAPIDLEDHHYWDALFLEELQETPLLGKGSSVYTKFTMCIFNIIVFTNTNAIHLLDTSCLN